MMSHTRDKNQRLATQVQLSFGSRGHKRTNRQGMQAHKQPHNLVVRMHHSLTARGTTARTARSSLTMCS
jgi:hypothetical protein